MTESSLLRTARHLAVNPVKAARLQLRMIRNVSEALGLDSVTGMVAQGRKLLARNVKRTEEHEAVDRQLGGVSLPHLQAPPTPFNHSVGPHRRFAMRSTSLSNIKALKDATGCTVNDIVLATVTGALRRYLFRRRVETKALDFRVIAPVSVRRDEEKGKMGNRVSSWIVRLPIDQEDPLARLEAIHATTGG